jgi:hypothetical protein
LRESVADGIAGRDGYPSRPEDIFLTDGASSAVVLYYSAALKRDPSHPDILNMATFFSFFLADKLDFADAHKIGGRWNFMPFT